MVNGDTIFFGFIILITAFPMIAIGISQYRSEKPVGFFSGIEPPKPEEVTDVKAYNHKHGIMWLLYGSGMILIFLLGNMVNENIAIAALVTECVGGILAMLFYHKRLEKLYVKKENR